MKVFTYSQARQQLSELLEYAKNEEVVIRRKDGSTFSLVPKRLRASPFDIPGIKSAATTNDILEAIRESRSTSTS